MRILLSFSHYGVFTYFGMLHFDYYRTKNSFEQPLPPGQASKVRSRCNSILLKDSFTFWTMYYMITLVKFIFCWYWILGPRNPIQMAKWGQNIDFANQLLYIFWKRRKFPLPRSIIWPSLVTLIFGCRERGAGNSPDPEAPKKYQRAVGNDVPL